MIRYATASTLGFPVPVAAPAATGGAGAGGSGAIAAAGGPIGIAIMAGVMLFQLWMSRKGPAQKVASTRIVDTLEPGLQENLDRYFAGPRTNLSQAEAIGFFDAAWAYLIGPEACGSPQLGAPGRRCIADRDRGGNPEWNWYKLYRDPIAGDPDVRLDSILGVPGEVFQDPERMTGLFVGLALIALALLW